MNMAYGPQGANIYGFEALTDWANKRFDAGLTTEKLQDTKPKVVFDELKALSKEYHEGRLEEIVTEKIDSNCPASELVQWVSERFGADFTEEQLADREQARSLIIEAGEEFLTQELTQLETYVLLQIYDGAWKDHLYAMDHLKESIFLRAFAEKDPKIEYKQEGFRMFNEMLDVIEDRVTSTIFKVRLEAGAQTRSVWNVSQTSHDEVNQFSMAQRQKAAAIAPQGEQKVKQIRLDQPKIGRNDPCSCGSGKKYKKCCGKNA
jgi:preprotein translocase subunit SecA